MANCNGLRKKRSTTATDDGDLNCDVGYSIDGLLYPKHWIRNDGDMAFLAYAALNFEHSLTVDRIVDEKYDAHRRESQYRIKFVGLELDENDWVYAKDVRGPALQQWQNYDKSVLKKIRQRYQNGHIIQNGKAAQTCGNNCCWKAKKRWQSDKLDELAYACFLVKQIEDGEKADFPEDFDFRTLNMTRAVNGKYYPKKWLDLPGDKEQVADGKLQVQRIVDEFVDSSSGVPMYWVKFVGRHIQTKKSVFKCFQLDNKVGEWRLYQKKLLDMARSELTDSGQK